MQPKANDYYYAANILKQHGKSVSPGLQQIIRDLEATAAEAIVWERGNHAA